MASLCGCRPQKQASPKVVGTIFLVHSRRPPKISEITYVMNTEFALVRSQLLPSFWQIVTLIIRSLPTLAIFIPGNFVDYSNFEQEPRLTSSRPIHHPSAGLMDESLHKNSTGRGWGSFLCKYLGEVISARVIYTSVLWISIHICWHIS